MLRVLLNELHDSHVALVAQQTALQALDLARGAS
jgi:hypothetical protein